MRSPLETGRWAVTTPRSMTRLRTMDQIEANKIDRDLARLYLRIERFANKVGTAELGRGAISVLSARRAVRKHMHPDDVKETEG